METECLRSLFRNHIANSPACAFATLVLYNLASWLAHGDAVFRWVVCNIAYHPVRTAIGLACTRLSDLNEHQLHYSSCTAMRS